MQPDGTFEHTPEGARPRAPADDVGLITWRAIVKVMTRPQPVTIPMVALFSIIPFYLRRGHEDL